MPTRPRPGYPAPPASLRDLPAVPTGPAPGETRTGPPDGYYTAQAYGKYLATSLGRDDALQVAGAIVAAVGGCPTCGRTAPKPPPADKDWLHLREPTPELPSDTAEVVAWLRQHGLGLGAGAGAVLSAVRADLHGACTACQPTEVPDGE